MTKMNEKKKEEVITNIKDWLVRSSNEIGKDSDMVVEAHELLLNVLDLFGEHVDLDI